TRVVQKGKREAAVQPRKRCDGRLDSEAEASFKSVAEAARLSVLCADASGLGKGRPWILLGYSAMIPIGLSSTLRLLPPRGEQFRLAEPVARQPRGNFQ